MMVDLVFWCLVVPSMALHGLVELMDSHPWYTVALPAALVFFLGLVQDSRQLAREVA